MAQILGRPGVILTSSRREKVRATALLKIQEPGRHLKDDPSGQQELCGTSHLQVAAECEREDCCKSLPLGTQKTPLAPVFSLPGQGFSVSQTQRKRRSGTSGSKAPLVSLVWLPLYVLLVVVSPSSKHEDPARLLARLLGQDKSVLCTVEQNRLWRVQPQANERHQS